MRTLFIKYKYLLLLLLLVFSFFIPNLLIGKIPIPADSLTGLYHPWRDNSYLGYNPGKFPVKNPLITDPVLQTYPWRFESIENLKNRILPLWNPYSFSGQPLLANVQSAAFSAFNIPFFVMPFDLAWGLVIILTTLLGAFFMYIFLISLKLAKAASIYGALVFPFSSFFIVWLQWGTIASTAIWLPLILYCINKLLDKSNPWLFLLLIFAFTQTVLSGHTQTAFYIIIATFLYLIFTSFKYKKIRITFLIILSFILSILICAPQIATSFEFVSLSNRSNDTAYFPGRSDWFIPYQNLAQLLAPDYFGNPATYNYWGIWNYAEFVTFIGIMPLFFAAISIVQKEKKTVFFTILVILSLFLALSNPISKLPFILNIPMISSFQPSRIIFLLTFSLSTLSAIGLEAFFKKPVNKKSIFAFSVISTPLLAISFVTFATHLFPYSQTINSVQVAQHNLIVPLLSLMPILLIIYLKKKNYPSLIVFYIAILFTVIELFRFSYKFLPFSSTQIIYPKTKITDYLMSRERPFRILSTDRRIFNANSFIPYKIESVSGYDPLYLKKYAWLIYAWESGNIEQSSFNRFLTPQNYNSNIADLLNVKYVITFDEINKPDFEKVFQEGSTYVYLNKNAQERVFFVSKIKKVANDKTELISILNNDNHKNVAYSQEFEYSSENLNAKAGIEKYDGQSLTIKTISDKSAPLIVSNINYPGWKAFIDGSESPIKEVNFTLQSLVIPKGEHIVTLKYAPKSFYNSLYFTAAGIFLSLIMFSFLWIKRYRL